MAKKYQSRREFFKRLTNRPDEAAAGSGISLSQAAPTDVLFERYSRKTLGDRHYSTEMSDDPRSLRGQLSRVGNVTSGLTAYTGTVTATNPNGYLTAPEAAHLLRRTGFGSKNADISYLQTLTPGAAVDYLFGLTPVTPSATPLNHYNNTVADSSSIALGADWTQTNLTFAAANTNDSSIDSYRAQSIYAWQWGTWLNGNASIREKMVNFWYHLIPVNFTDILNATANGATASQQYIKLLRDNAVSGNFQTLIKAIAKNPAMLVYLSGQYSTATAPNENFGRELLELFMLGKLPTQNYTEDDVQSGAKVLSGWRVSSFTSTFPFTVSFNSSYHNQTNKTFSTFFNSTTINNQTGTNGANEFDLYFNLLFAQQGITIAKYICRRLYRFFVYYDIDANVETNVIAPMATALMTAVPTVSNAWDILPVLKLLFKSQHFFDLVNRGVMIKSPVDLLAGALRMFNVNTTAAVATPATTQLINQYAIWLYFHNYCNSNLEQGFGLVPNVSGWKAYYQEPGYYQNWINTNTIQQRYKLMGTLFTGIGAGGLTMKIDVIAFAQQYPATTVPDPDAMINAFVQTLLCVDLDATTKDNLKTSNLLGGLANTATTPTNHYWTDAWNAYVAGPTTANTTTVRNKLTALLTAILQLPEFQLM